MIRGITAPKSVELGTEHATPVCISITASEGVKYDFTTITLNGRKIRALDTRRLTVFELCSLAGIKPHGYLGAFHFFHLLFEQGTKTERH